MAQRRLSEVAKKVGVSEATVSRVLNGKPGVSESTRQAVLTALDVLGYERPTQLRGERARLVGLVLPELQNPIFPALADVVGSALAQQGFTPVLCTCTGGVSEPDYVELLLAQQVSGVVFAGGSHAEEDANHEHHYELVRRKLPVVLVNASIDLDYPVVSCDDAVAVEQAFGHLVALGHQRIGMVLGPRDHIPSRRKLAAFRACADRLGITVDEHTIGHTMFSVEGGQAVALGVIRAVRRLGLSTPEDVSVIGYDDSALMTCTDPPLTTVRQPIEAMGRAAVELLAALIAGNEVSMEELLFEPELVVRASAAPARARATLA
jgi:DNA-binding LacI/PurR family transcriptional regulator